MNFILNANHHANLRWSLQVLGVSPLRPFSTASYGVRQGTAPIGIQGPLATVPFGEDKAKLALVETWDAASIEAECAGFEAEAYGAVLGIIYYRMIGDSGRITWDLRAQEVVNRACAQIRTIDAQGRNNLLQMQSQRLPPLTFRRDSKHLSALKQAIWSKVDFMNSLRQVRTTTFQGINLSGLIDDDAFAAKPWCQSDREFQMTANYALSGKAKGLPIINRGYDEKQRKKTLDEGMGEALKTIVQAKLIEYLDGFLKVGVGLLKGAVRKGLQELLDKVPVGDLLFDSLSERYQEIRLDGIIERYKQDEQRRFFLSNLHWGTYQRLPPLPYPTGGIPKGVG